MPIIDLKRLAGCRIGLTMLKEAGTIALFNDKDVVYCIDCMFEKHSHELPTFWSLEAEDIASSYKIYICDECGKKID